MRNDLEISRFNTFRSEQALCSRGQGNPAIRGFFVEQLLLADIAERGLPALGKSWEGRLNLVVFGSNTHTPELPISNKPQKIIFIPSTFKFMTVDAILYMSEKQKGGKMVATVVPLQITIANKHSDSEANFFPTWGIYEQKLSIMEHISDWRVIFWIHDTIEAIPADKRREEVVERSVRKQKERTVLINPTYNRCLLPVGAVSKRIGQLHDISRGGSGNEVCATTTTMDNPDDEAGGGGEGEVQGAQVQSLCKSLRKKVRAPPL